MVYCDLSVSGMQAAGIAARIENCRVECLRAAARSLSTYGHAFPRGSGDAAATTEMEGTMFPTSTTVKAGGTPMHDLTDCQCASALLAVHATGTASASASAGLRAVPPSP